jgi:hypothetical protein
MAEEEDDEVRGWGVEKGDPSAELERRISSDMGREPLRGAISYLECKLGNSAGSAFVLSSFVLDTFLVDFMTFSLDVKN